MNLSSIKINKYGNASQIDLTTEIVELDHGLDTIRTSQRYQIEFPEIIQEVADYSLIGFHNDFDMTKISTSKISPFSANNYVRAKIVDHIASFSNKNIRILRKSKNPDMDSSYPTRDFDGYPIAISQEIVADYHWNYTENGITWKTHWNYEKVFEDTSYYDVKNSIWNHYVINNNNIPYDIAIELIDESGIYRSDWYNLAPGESQYISMKDVIVYKTDILKNYYEEGSTGIISTSHDGNKLTIDIDNSFGNKQCNCFIECSNNLYLTTGNFVLSSISNTENYIYDSDWAMDHTGTYKTTISGAAVDFTIPIITSDTSNSFISIDLKLLYKTTSGINDSFDWRLNSGTSYTISSYNLIEGVSVIDVLTSGDPTRAHVIHVDNVRNNAAIVGIEIVRKRIGIYDSIIMQSPSDSQLDFDTICGVAHADSFDHRYACDRKWLRSEESLISSSNWLVNRTLPVGQSLTTIVASTQDLDVEYVLSSITNYFPTPIIEYIFGTDDMDADNDWYFREYRGDQYKDIVHARSAGKIQSVMQQVNLENCTKFQFKGLGSSSNSKYFNLESFKTTYLKYSDFNPVGNKLDMYSIIDPTGQTFLLGKEKLKFFIKSFVKQDMKYSEEI